MSDGAPVPDAETASSHRGRSYEEALRVMTDAVTSTVRRYQHRPDMLIQMLLDLQDRRRWLPQELLAELSRQANVPLARIYRIATFYEAFSLAPKGEHAVRVCTGTACQVRGASLVVRVVEELLNVAVGGATRDLKYSLETVNCVGCCPIAPVVLCDDDYHGNVTPAKVRDLLASYK